MKKFRFFSIAVAVVMALFVSVWAATQKVTSGRAIGVAAVPVGVRACSSPLIEYYFGQPPTNATITKIEYNLGAISVNKGAFTIDSLRIECNPPPPPNNVVTLPWNGTGTLTTTYFNGQPAKTTCKVSFCGKCTAGYMEAGQMVNMCNKSYSNSNMTITY